jgi:uncharacterized membrane protein
MKGNILGFDPDTNTGAISGYDGQRYDFVRLEWRGPDLPARREAVDFIPENGRATQIFPRNERFDPREGATANTIYVLYLVGLFVPFVSIAGVIMAYVNRREAPEWVQTHYRFQVRTFWIGLLYGVIGLVTFIIVIGFFFLCFVFVWWIVRCVKGMQAISAGAAYEHPTSWLW